MKEFTDLRNVISMYLNPVQFLLIYENDKSTFS